MLLLLCASFFKITSFILNSFRNTIRVSNCLDPDQDRHFVGPDLGLKLFAKVISNKQMPPLAWIELDDFIPSDILWFRSHQLKTALTLCSKITPFDAFEISCI